MRFRFKRKKSEGKMMSKEALIVHTHFDAATPPMVIRRSSPAGLHQQSSPTTNTKGRGSTNNLYKVSYRFKFYKLIDFIVLRAKRP